ncbi:DinB family protein [Micromonospora sp. LOL_021]|uniref:DinB family protein n=1 Tax=Micromonospora sp. LOL_021 TaxID=3345417 RepID=UPI003A8AF21D
MTIDMFIDPDADPRAIPPRLGDERATLAGFLDWHRRTLELKCGGLDPQQLARRSVQPSALSLLGLVRHLADVERYWFRQVMAGEDAPPRFYSQTAPNDDFDGSVADPAAVTQAWKAWREEIQYAERFVADAAGLDVTGSDRRGPISLRWVLTHMIEEYARHNGHADLLRECIDGAVGQ